MKSYTGKYSSSDSRCLILDGELIAFAPIGLECYSIPKEVTIIGEDAFRKVDNIKNITIHNNVTTIKERAFTQCYGLTEFNGKFASEDKRCLIIDGELKGFAPAGLTEYEIPEGVTSTGKLVFWDCKNLKSITLPESIIIVNEFGDTTCPDNLSSLYCKSVNPPRLNGEFFSNPTIYVPMEYVDKYKVADGWKEYSNRITGHEF